MLSAFLCKRLYHDPIVGIFFLALPNMSPLPLPAASYKLIGSLVIPYAAYSCATDSAIICFVTSLISWLLVLPLAIVSSACVTSSTLFSTFNTALSLPVISSFTTSVSISKTFITVFELGLSTTFIPPKLSATMLYSPSASSAKLCIPISTADLDIKVFIVTDFPAPDLANITML